MNKLTNEEKEKYDKWITENVPEAYGTCQEVTEKMLAAFPELERVRGYYYCLTWGEREHWWLKTKEGAIVDPTATQFPTKGNGVYAELDPDAKEPTGMCPECGEYVYDNNQFCCLMHERSYIRYLETGIL